MKLCIHRGTRQVGGTCIEIETQGKRLAVDLGLPLDAEPGTEEALLPDVPGLTGHDPTLLALLISHAHQDHYGLARHIRPDLPVYIGEKANAILRAAADFVPNGFHFADPRHWVAGRAETIGPFTFTPYPVDHSAFDAYALLIEAGGKRVFYSGDFRGHGNAGYKFQRLLDNPPQDVDALLMEGTTIGGAGRLRDYPSERGLIGPLARAMRETPGMCLVQASAQNIDRIVNVQIACNRARRQFVIDCYAAEVLRATGHPAIQGGILDQARIYVPESQRKRIAKKKLFEQVGRYRPQRLFPEELAGAAPRLTLLYRPTMLDDLVDARCLNGAHLVYSLWEGYLEQEDGAAHLARLTELGIPKQSIHTSGHASVRDLQRMAAAIAPRMLVPIHSFHGDRYPEFFDNVVRKDDGEWWGV